MTKVLIPVICFLATCTPIRVSNVPSTITDAQLHNLKARFSSIGNVDKFEFVVIAGRVRPPRKGPVETLRPPRPPKPKSPNDKRSPKPKSLNNDSNRKRAESRIY